MQNYVNYEDDEDLKKFVNLLDAGQTREARLDALLKYDLRSLSQRAPISFPEACAYLEACAPGRDWVETLHPYAKRARDYWDQCQNIAWLAWLQSWVPIQHTIESRRHYIQRVMYVLGNEGIGADEQQKLRALFALPDSELFQPGTDARISFNVQNALIAVEVAMRGRSDWPLHNLVNAWTSFLSDLRWDCRDDDMSWAPCLPYETPADMLARYREVTPWEPVDRAVYARAYLERAIRREEW